MNADIFAPINEPNEVFAESKNAPPFTVIPEKISAEIFNAAKFDRDKTIDIVNRSYKARCHGADGVEDFIIAKHEPFFTSANVFASINELNKVFAESKNAPPFTAIPEKISAEIFNAAKSDRDKTIDIVNRSYKARCHGADGVDDFVTAKSKRFFTSANIFASINELNKVFAESKNAPLFTVIPEKISAEIFNAAKFDRDKMIDILNRFYKARCHGADGVDDFVTLFGVYCNYYILYGLHLILKEDDFGTNKIFDNIANDALKNYLSLIRAGICTQDAVHFEDAVKLNSEYSLAHFYLFLRCLRQYWSRSYDEESEKKLLLHYNAIKNSELKNYAVGLSNSTPRIGNYVANIIVNYVFGMADSLLKMSTADDAVKADKEKIFDNPPLPCSYLMTLEEKQRLVYLSVAFLSRILMFTVNRYFVGILNDEAAKDFSEALSFVVKEAQTSDINELRAKLFRFFKERKPNPFVKQLIDYGLFVLPDHLEDMKKIFRNLDDGYADFPILDRAATSVNQSNQELEQIYLSGQTLIPKTNIITEPIGIDSVTMIKRLFFLEIPYTINWTNHELYNLMERISAQREKDTMVRDYMHTYSNMKADTLYDIARLLLKRNNPEDQKNGRALLLEYALKKELSNSVYMMQLMYKNSVDDLKKMITKSLVGAHDDHETVRDVFNKSLLQCFINVFYADPSAGKTAKMRTNLKHIWSENFLETERPQFEQHFMEQDFDCLAWISREGINFTFEQESVWKKIFMERDGFASTFLKIIFDELCVNVFKYGDLKRAIKLRLSEDDDRNLVITFENHFTRSRVASGSQIGVNLLRRRIKILHDDAKKNCVEAVDDKIQKFFRIKLLLPAALFAEQNF